MKKMEVDIGIQLPNFANEYQHFCHRNAIRNILYLLGVPEYELLIKNTIDIQLVSDKENRNFFYPAVINTRPVLSDIAYLLSDWKYTKSWDEIITVLTAGDFVLVNTDVYYLPYTKFYLKEHGSHVVILLEQKKSEFLVLDWYSPQFFLGWLTKKELELARESENPYEENHAYSGYPISCAWQRFKLATIPKFSKDDLLLELLQDIVTRLRKVCLNEQRIRNLFCFESIYLSEQCCSAQIVEDLFLLIAERKLCRYQLMTYGNELKQFESMIKQICALLDSIIDYYDKLKMMALRAQIAGRFPMQKVWDDYSNSAIDQTIELEKVIDQYLYMNLE